MSPRQELTIMALYPGRSTDRVSAFIREYAGPGALDESRSPAKFTYRTMAADGSFTEHEATARTMKEALWRALANEEWGAVFWWPRTDVRTVDVLAATTCDGHTILGVSYGGDPASDGVVMGGEVLSSICQPAVQQPLEEAAGEHVIAAQRMMHRMMTAYPAEAALLVAHRHVPASSRDFANLVRHARKRTWVDWDLFVRGSWQERIPVRAPAGLPGYAIEAIAHTCAEAHLRVWVRDDYPVRYSGPETPWTLMFEAPHSAVRQQLGDREEDFIAALVEATRVYGPIRITALDPATGDLVALNAMDHASG